MAVVRGLFVQERSEAKRTMRSGVSPESATAHAERATEAAEASLVLLAREA